MRIWGRNRTGTTSRQPTRPQPTARTAGASIDALEPRRLFSATLEVTRTLVVTGTDDADVITVDLEIDQFGGRTLRVTENGAVTGRFAQEAVVDIIVLCLDGNDFVRIGSGGFFGSIDTPAQIEGGDGNDEINGGFGNDTIFGGAGDDFLTGYGGNDFIDAGPGNDTVVVHIGNDTVFGGPGDDQLNGQETGKSSSFDGGDGNDRITGTSRRDQITGGPGNDVIDGGRGADRVFGGDGDDQITVNQRSARLLGQGGADAFLGATGRNRRAVKDFTPGLDSFQPVPPAVPVAPPVVASPADSLLDDTDHLLG